MLCRCRTNAIAIVMFTAIRSLVSVVGVVCLYLRLSSISISSKRLMHSIYTATAAVAATQSQVCPLSTREWYSRHRLYTVPLSVLLFCLFFFFFVRFLHSTFSIPDWLGYSVPWLPSISHRTYTCIYVFILDKRTWMSLVNAERWKYESIFRCALNWNKCLSVTFDHMWNNEWELSCRPFRQRNVMSSSPANERTRNVHTHTQ